MSRIFLAVAVFAVIFSTSPLKAFADSTPGIDELQNQNAQLKQRTEKLEQEMAELRKTVAEQAKAPSRAPQQSAPARLTDDDFKRILELVEKGEGKNPLWSSLDVQFYGYIKADAAYDNSRVTTGNYVLYVDNESSGKDNDNEFNLTANQSRFGLKIKGPEEDGVRTSGQVEIDFYGNGSAENKAAPLLRHAFMNIEWPDERFSIIAGQTSDVISPLFPNTLNYTVLWDAGNIGYRHPQIRLTKGMQLCEDVDMQLQGAISRTIGDDELDSTAGAKSGEDSGFPTLQGRVGFTFPWFGYKPTTIGFSGHWGVEEYDDLSDTATSEEFDSWSLNFDMLQPINELWTIKSEAFCGKNLNDYFGGIGQGVRSTGAGTVASPTTYHNEIGSRGGWIAASLTPKSKWSYNFGVGIDDVENDDINSSQRAMNRSIFGNAICSINKSTQIGFELSQWRTEYKGSGDADDIRVQTSFIYKF
ncbi:MAG: DcaP family trimeric outer membrane transporter [Phycisphaerae bacterium]|nr:DcaP family trimeric outer membrane transporter [Phycisphaerae bacterium]